VQVGKAKDGDRADEGDYPHEHERHLVREYVEMEDQEDNHQSCERAHLIEGSHAAEHVAASVLRREAHAE
jgi:hypothetical protein